MSRSRSLKADNYIPNVCIDFGFGQIERCIGIAGFAWEVTREQSFNIFGIIQGSRPTTSRRGLACLVFRSTDFELILGKDHNA